MAKKTCGKTASSSQSPTSSSTGSPIRPEKQAMTSTRRSAAEWAATDRLHRRQRGIGRLDPELRQALTKRAERDRETTSSVIRKALRKYLQVG